MSAVTTADIRIEAAVPIINLQGQQMDFMRNSHADISLKGFLDEEASEEVMSGFMEPESI